MAPPDCPAGGYVGDYVSFWAIWLALILGAWWFFRATRGRTGKARLVVGNLLVLFALAWTAVVVAETYLRYVYDGTDQYGLTMTNRAWFGRHVLGHLNSSGYRDREFAAVKPPGVVRVACVGDSFTMGWGVRDLDDLYPRKIGAALDARFPGKFEVLNVSAPGLSTTDENDMIEATAKDGAFDRVVLGYCLNDPDNFLPAGRAFDRESAPRLPLIPQSWSFLADFLWFHVRLRADPKVRGYFDWEKEAYEDPRIWDQQCAQFRRMKDFCDAAKIRLDVVVFPFFAQWGEKYEFDSCHERVAQAWKRLGVDVVDLREAYRGIPASELVVGRFDGHPNERAHAIAARVILDRVFDVR
jgi:hypothetical protein